MNLSKTNAKKILRIIENSKKKVFTCEDLVKATGFNLEVIYLFIENFYDLIRFDPSYNLKNEITNIRSYIEKEENKEAKKKERKGKRIGHNEYKKYKNFMDYVSKNMTSGGFLDTGYKLTKKDKKMLIYYLNKEFKK